MSNSKSSDLYTIIVLSLIILIFAMASTLAFVSGLSNAGFICAVMAFAAGVIPFAWGRSAKLEAVAILTAWTSEKPSADKLGYYWVHRMDWEKPRIFEVTDHYDERRRGELLAWQAGDDCPFTVALMHETNWSWRGPINHPELRGQA